jgi:hypothetical protein
MRWFAVGLATPLVLTGLAGFVVWRELRAAIWA